MTQRPRVVIIGGGFGGLWAARTLAGSDLDVHLIDTNNYHTFFPLVYQVAAAELDPEDIAYPLRSIFRKQTNLSITRAAVRHIDGAAKRVTTANGTFDYDYLVVAAGSIPNYFGIPGTDEYVFPLRTMEQAVRLRNHILGCFEQASALRDQHEREQLLTFVIIGGGPTGVEFAGALMELIQGPICKDFPRVEPSDAKVVLLEGGDSLLPGLPERLQNYAHDRLASMGVEVRTRALASQVREDAVVLKDGTVIPTRNAVWTAGVRGDPIAAQWGLQTGRGGRILVRPSLEAEGQPGTFVIGDFSIIPDHPYPQVAQVAIQQGQTAAKNILRRVAGEKPRAFRYRDYGTMAVIGRNAAVAHLFNRWQFTGFLAWLIWLSIHITWLIGYRNRLSVLTSWAWDYLFFERGSRIILPAEWPEPART